MSKNKKTASAVQTVQLVKKSAVFSFKKRAPIAKLGLNQASWVSAVNEVPEVGDEFNRVVVTVQTKPKDQTEIPFVLTKTYHLGENKRGPAAFLDDYNTWSEISLTEDDFYNNFDGLKDAGKLMVVDIGHRKVGKEWKTYIKGFYPDGTTEVPAES